nr:hypothetical protein Iba_chr01bCG6360 [Ipomoea batatas]
MNLDMYSMTLKMPNGVAIVVDDEDVEAVLVLPRGPKVIIDRAKHEKSVILNSWQWVCAPTCDPQPRGYARGCQSKLVPVCDPFPNSHTSCVDEQENTEVHWAFVGLNDRVRSGGCTPSRMLPSFVGCDSTMLKEREEWEITSGGFGRGEVLELVRPMKKCVLPWGTQAVFTC